jgi:hypothetical protein
MKTAPLAIGPAALLFAQSKLSGAFARKSFLFAGATFGIACKSMT